MFVVICFILVVLVYAFDSISVSAAYAFLGTYTLDSWRIHRNAKEMHGNPDDPRQESETRLACAYFVHIWCIFVPPPLASCRP